MLWMIRRRQERRLEQDDGPPRRDPAHGAQAQGGDAGEGMGGIEQRRVAGAFADPADMQAQILGVAVEMEGPAEGRRRLLRTAGTARVEGADAKILAKFLEQRPLAGGRESVDR